MEGGNDGNFNVSGDVSHDGRNTRQVNVIRI